MITELVSHCCSTRNAFCTVNVRRVMFDNDCYKRGRYHCCYLPFIYTATLKLIRIAPDFSKAAKWVTNGTVTRMLCTHHTPLTISLPEIWEEDLFTVLPGEEEEAR